MKLGVLIVVFILYPLTLCAQSGWSAVTHCFRFYAQDAEHLHIADFGDSSIVYSRSSDGGVTWQTIATIDLAAHLHGATPSPISPGGAGLGIENILFVDSLQGVITGDIEDAREGAEMWLPHGLILTTLNAGLTWHIHDNGGVTRLSHLRAMPGGVAEVAAYSISSDGLGEPWSGLVKVFQNDSIDLSCLHRGYSDVDRSMSAIDFTDSLTAFGSYPAGRVKSVSHDAGHSWIPIDSILSDNAKALNITTMNFGRDSILFGSDSVSNFRSTDLGVTWSKIDAKLPRNPKYLSFKGNAVYAANQRGLYYSDDAGVTWDSVNTVSAGLQDLQIANDSVAYALISGTLYKTWTHGLFSAVTIPPERDTFTIYPDPASDYLLISRSDSPVAVFNAVGVQQNCPKSISSDGIRLDVRKLQPGVYFIHSGNTISKVVVAH